MQLPKQFLFDEHVAHHRYCYNIHLQMQQMQQKQE
jgi:hypothetical protein